MHGEGKGHKMKYEFYLVCPILGEPVPAIQPPPDDKESDTMKTYRSMDSDRPTKQTTGHHHHQQATADYANITQQATLESLTKTFDYLKKAVVSR